MQKWEIKNIQPQKMQKKRSLHECEQNYANAEYYKIQPEQQIS